MKRFICVMLTLIMLVSLVPATAITAEAATLSTSGAAITVLKNMLNFQKECYQINGTKEFRIGYGAICPGTHKESEYDSTGVWQGTPHKTSQDIADKKLRETMKSMDVKVNSFASSNNLSLKQGQFDALTVFSYLTGTAWMSGNGTVKTAVKNNVGSTELMNAFYGVLRSNLSNNTTAEDRSKVLVNMYMNGTYNNKPSENYSYVIYDPDGGEMPVKEESYKLTKSAGDTYKLFYDASKSVSHPVTPTKIGHKFMGWYFRANDGRTITGRSASLNGDCMEKTLVALWQGNSVTPDTAAGSAEDVYYKVPVSKLASAFLMDKPAGALWPENLITLKWKEVLVTKEYLAADGSRWGLIDPTPYNSRNMWVCLSGNSGSSSGGSGWGGSTVSVKITNTYVNIRKEASIYAAKAGTLHYNDTVYITSTAQANGFLWGYAHKDSGPVGWIALMYTDYNTAKYEQGGSSSGSGASNTAIAKATVTYNGYVHLRDNPGTDNKIVGSLAKNEIVDVYEIKTVNGHQWGRTKGGWLCLSYAHVQMLSGTSDISNPGSGEYAFSGVAQKKLDVYVDTTTNSNFVDAEHAPKSGDAVTVITMKRIGSNEHDPIWAKIGWTYKYKDVYGYERSATKYGWVNVGSDGLTINNDSIKLNTVKFTVVAENATVRKEPDNGSGVITKLDKGYEFNVEQITVFGENIWANVELEEINGGNTKVDSGWVNLASKYVKRSDKVTAPPASGSGSTDGSWFGTIVGADRVNVRSEAKISGKHVGQLANGAVVQILGFHNGWYKVDADVDNNPNTASWVFGDYIEEGVQSDEIANAPSSHGVGVVANTYGGLNVRQGPGTAYAIVGNKLLPGSQVKILETTYTGTTKWGRTEQGWVCMDYISMLSETVDVPETPREDAPNGGEWVGDYDEVDRTTTTAVYTGKAARGGVQVWANTEHHSQEDTSHVVRVLNADDPVTIYELIAVVERVDITDEDNVHDSNTTVETVTTHYWARTNDGYILDPQNNINLDALDEKAHTLTGSDTLNVRPANNGPVVDGNPIGKLEKGDVVKVTRLAIVKDKVWGRIEYSVDGTTVENGWIRLDYMAEGALYEEPEATTPPANQAPVTPPPSNNNSTGDTGKSDGTYRYDGKVINTNELKVRAKATTNSAEVTKLKAGTPVYIYETTIADGMAWGRCDAGWVYLYYINLTPRDTTLVDARVVYNPATPIYSDANRTEQVGTYQSMATIDIYEIVGNMARTELGWVYTGDLL